MSFAKQALEVVGHIYDAALEPARWPGVVESILSFVQAKSGMLFTPFDRIDSAGFSFPVNIAQEFLQIYASRYQPHDVWALASRDAGLMRAGNLVVGDEVVPRRRLLASPFYREFLRPQDTSRIVFACVFEGNEHPSVMTTVLTVHRTIRSRPFSERSKERMRLLIPHLSRALGVMFRLRDAELKIAASRGALDRLATGVLLIGERRQVVFANRAARSILAERDGLALLPRGSYERLVAGVHAKTVEIEAALGVALAAESVEVPHFSSGIAVERSGGGGAIVLNISALSEVNAFGVGPEHARAIVFLTDTSQPPQINTSLLKQVYPLSDAEVRVVQQVCAGGTLNEVAARLGVSDETVRTQLQSVFRKTGAGRQAELVKLVLSLSSSLR